MTPQRWLIWRPGHLLGSLTAILVILLGTVSMLPPLQSAAQSPQGLGFGGGDLGLQNAAVIEKPNAEKLRKRYPYESLAERLSYETAEATGRSKAAEAAPLPAAIAKRLQTFEEQ